MTVENGTYKRCKYCEQENMDLLFLVLDNENDVTITNGDGTILRVSNSYERHYLVKREDVEGKTVFEMEENGVFKPSVTAKVLKEKRKITLLQTNKAGEKILTTGVPIFLDDGEIEYVVSYNSIDIADMTNIQDQLSKLGDLTKEYSDQINQLRMRDLADKELIAKSKSMKDISEMISQIADTNANVLITGETGVGKSMVARIIHKSSNRAGGPFVEINCGTIPESLIESELFGYEKGSFTGASSKGKVGKIELARGGTLFLDEVGELPLNMQIKFLEVIQERYITRIGGLEKIEVDFRLIVATNRDLKKDIASGLFREDLFYRLNVIPMHIPPVRERQDDLIHLINSFLKRFNLKYGRFVELSAETYAILQKQSWPGNIRQVENLIERLVIMAKNNIVTPQHLPSDEGIQVFDCELADIFPKPECTLADMTEEWEKKIFIKAFDMYRTSIAVGKALGISQTTAARKLRKYIPNYVEQRSRSD